MTKKTKKPSKSSKRSKSQRVTRSGEQIEDRSLLIAASSETAAVIVARSSVYPKEHELSESPVASRPRLLHLLSWAAVQLDTFVRPAYEVHPDAATRAKFAALLAEIRHIVDTEYKPL